MAEPIQNMGTSVRARLLNLSRSTGRPFETLLVHYALERLLYRLTRTEHAERFVLKGAMLLMTWLEIPLRATRDIDFLGFGEPSPEGMLQGLPGSPRGGRKRRRRFRRRGPEG